MRGNQEEPQTEGGRFPLRFGMKPNEGRLQTAEHILAKIIENKVADTTIGISKFDETAGILEIKTQTTDLKQTIDLNELQNEVNEVIGRNLEVNKTIKPRAEAEKEVDLRKVPSSVTEVRIIDISGFDKRPCRDPHADNTKQIGKFTITSLERVGNNRYRISFMVE
jgi:Ser-tRNA(Ala) deacylase AlaX